MTHTKLFFNPALRRLASILGILLLAGVVSGCKRYTSSYLNLRFPERDQGLGFSSGQDYAHKDPGMLILYDPQQAEAPGSDVHFPAQLAETLRAVDFKQDFVVAVFRGLITASSPKYTVEVQKVTREGNKVVIKAQFGSPGAGDFTQPVNASPYQIIRVTKKGVWAQEIRFVLEVNDKELTGETLFIP